MIRTLEDLSFEDRDTFYTVGGSRERIPKRERRAALPVQQGEWITIVRSHAYGAAYVTHGRVSAAYVAPYAQHTHAVTLFWVPPRKRTSKGIRDAWPALLMVLRGRVEVTLPADPSGWEDGTIRGPRVLATRGPLLWHHPDFAAYWQAVQACVAGQDIVFNTVPLAVTAHLAREAERHRELELEA